jgi:hypothetical protein
MSPRLRLAGLALTALALWSLRGELVGDDLVSPVSTRSMPATSPPPPRPIDAGRRQAEAANAASPAAGATDEPAWGTREPLDDALRDPFSRPRQAVKPAAPAPALVVAAPPPAAAAPPPPPAPRVPYRFVGLMTENGRPTSVFLALGEQLLQARPGDLLEGGYQLRSIAPRELIFLNPQLNLTVRMPVDGEIS